MCTVDYHMQMVCKLVWYNGFGINNIALNKNTFTFIKPPFTVFYCHTIINFCASVATDGEVIL